MENLEDFLVFACVAETGSFTAASKELRKSVPTVSKHVRRLEESLALKLIQRSTHHLVLTEAGELIYGHCRRIAAELDEVRAHAVGLSEEIKGTLRIHSTPGVGRLVSPAAFAFMDKYPQISVELTISQVAANLMQHGADMMICSRDIRQDSDDLRVGLISRELGAVPFVVCAAPAYLEKHGTPKTPHDLEGHTCLIDLTQKAQPNLWQFADPQGDVYEVCVGGSFRSNLESAVLAAVVRGAGIARLPAYTVEAEINTERLTELFPGRVQSDRTVKVFYPRSEYLPKKVRAFIDVLEKHLDSSGSKQA